MPDSEHQTKVSHTVLTAKLRHGGTFQPHNYIYIYIYAFSRRFYPKRLTLHSSYSFHIFSQFVSLGSTIKESISKQVAQHKNQRIDALPTVLTILRATPSKATGISPFELMTGRVMKLPIDPEIAPADLGPLVVATQQSVLKQLRERLEVLHASAALKQQQSDLTNDTQFNPTSEVKFSEGDMVMVRVFVKQGAFTPRWHGPYEVKAICNSCVATTVKGKLRWYHMSQCKSFKSTQNK